VNHLERAQLLKTLTVFDGAQFITAARQTAVLDHSQIYPIKTHIHYFLKISLHIPPLQ